MSKFDFVLVLFAPIGEGMRWVIFRAITSVKYVDIFIRDTYT